MNKKTEDGIIRLQALLLDLAVHFDVDTRDAFAALSLHRGDGEGSKDVGDYEYSFEKSLELLKDFDWNIILSPIAFEKSVVPAALTYTGTHPILIGTENWYVMPQSNLPHLSSPYIHNLQFQIKMNFSNGNCYREGKFIGVMDLDTLILLRDITVEKYGYELPPIVV